MHSCSGMDRRCSPLAAVAQPVDPVRLRPVPGGTAVGETNEDLPCQLRKGSVTPFHSRSSTHPRCRSSRPSSAEPCRHVDRAVRSDQPARRDSGRGDPAIDAAPVAAGGVTVPHSIGRDRSHIVTGQGCGGASRPGFQAAPTAPRREHPCASASRSGCSCHGDLALNLEPGGSMYQPDNCAAGVLGPRASSHAGSTAGARRGRSADHDVGWLKLPPWPVCSWHTPSVPAPETRGRSSPTPRSAPKYR